MKYVFVEPNSVGQSDFDSHAFCPGKKHDVNVWVNGHTTLVIFHGVSSNQVRATSWNYQRTLLSPLFQDLLYQDHPKALGGDVISLTIVYSTKSHQSQSG